MNCHAEWRNPIFKIWSHADKTRSNNATEKLTTSMWLWAFSFNYALTPHWTLPRLAIKVTSSRSSTLLHCLSFTLFTIAAPFTCLTSWLITWLKVRQRSFSFHVTFVSVITSLILLQTRLLRIYNNNRTLSNKFWIQHSLINSEYSTH